jgi:GTP-binding protein
MAIPKIISAEFVLSAFNASQFPKAPLPEVAFWGRSNVGKSSLINTLLNRKNLVRTSSRPGCTQSINFFLINGIWHFVDLPGYGYAQVPLAVKANWLHLIDAYWEEREGRGAVVFLMDCRRRPKDEDVELLQYLHQQGCHLIPVLTKADKLKPGQRAQARADIDKSLASTGIDFKQLLWFSALTQEGRKELWGQILAFFTPPR